MTKRLALIHQATTADHESQGCWMSTIERIDQWIDIARKLGYEVRYDYFGGTGGGICEYKGSKILFIDLALTSMEQLEHLRNALTDEPLLYSLDLPESIKLELDPSNRAA